MMAHKGHNVGAEYAERWRGMVEQSVKTLKTYDDAVAALEDAPTCSATPDPTTDEPRRPD